MCLQPVNILLFEHFFATFWHCVKEIFALLGSMQKQHVNEYAREDSRLKTTLKNYTRKCRKNVDTKSYLALGDVANKTNILIAHLYNEDKFSQTHE